MWCFVMTLMDQSQLTCLASRWRLSKLFSRFTLFSTSELCWCLNSLLESREERKSRNCEATSFPWGSAAFSSSCFPRGPVPVILKVGRCPRETPPFSYLVCPSLVTVSTPLRKLQVALLDLAATCASSVLEQLLPSLDPSLSICL